MSSIEDKPTELGWTNGHIIDLINEYKKKTCLWDPKHPHFRVQAAKYEAWCELAEMFECEITDLRKKFNSIFASHRREKAKVRIGGRSTWFLYNELNFLPTHIPYDTAASSTQIEIKSKTAGEQATEESTEESEDDNRESPIDIIIKEEPQLEEQTLPKIQNVNSKPRLTRVLKRKLVIEPEEPSILERKLYRRQNFCKKKDECDSFGEYIAMSLRKHNERTRSMIKQAINNILFEQEMKKYNVSSSQYVVISTVDGNPLVSD